VQLRLSSLLNQIPTKKICYSTKELFDKFQTKGNMTLELLLFQSVLGPIGLPATEAVYTGVTAAEKPEGVPEENWLPISCKDEDMDIVLRIYVSDLEKMKTWQAPKAEKLSK